MEEQSKKTSLVIYPSILLGHLVSMVQLANLLLRHGFAVTIVIVDSPNDNHSAALAAANPSLTFHRLPPPPPPPSSEIPDFLGFSLIRRSNSHLRSFLASASPAAVIADFFCSYAVEVTAELQIPCYSFYTSGANILATFLYFPVLHSATGESFRVIGKEIVKIPGIPPLPADHLPDLLLDRDNGDYKGLLDHSVNFVKSNGIIVNTIDALERTVLEAITAGRCVPDGIRTPPVYCVGPLISAGGGPGNGDECLRWLDVQPRASVVFVCFGSVGLVSEKQLREIAGGLERSKQRFLWVVRSPPSDPTKRLKPPPEPELEKLLPSGFLDRTKERGLVVKSWAPQAAVLKHESVGGFVTHCGWNSILEAMAAGVPMLGWPLYAEQRMNKVYLVEQLELGVGIEGYDEEMVAAGEVEAKVRWLMDSEGGRELREGAALMKEKAAEALREGGASAAALIELVNKWKQC